MAKNLFIIGNWKMNPPTINEAKKTASEISRIASKAKRTTLVIAPPATFLSPLAAKKTKLFFAAQDVSSHLSGAHTGEVSAKMAKSVGARFAIVGHSERRATGDSDAVVSEKFARSIEAGLTPILCVGEKKRDSEGSYFSEIANELSAVFKSGVINKNQKFIVAYEPVWAVGGSYANALSPEEMGAMAIFIKKTCAQYVSKEFALKIPILYGGSVDADNAKAMLLKGGIDGLLVGRASLDPRGFKEIIQFADAR